MKTTAAQKTVLAAVESGKLHTVRTGTREGNVAERLIKGGLIAAVSTFIPSETTYAGAFIPCHVNYGKMMLTHAGRAAL